MSTDEPPRPPARSGAYLEQVQRIAALESQSSSHGVTLILLVLGVLLGLLFGFEGGTGYLAGSLLSLGGAVGLGLRDFRRSRELGRLGRSVAEYEKGLPAPSPPELEEGS